MSEDKFDIDHILRSAIDENKDRYEDFGPAFDKIQLNVRNMIKKRRNKRLIGMALRGASVLAAAVILFNVMLLFFEAEPVKAYQTVVRKLVYGIFNDPSQSKTEAEIIKTASEIKKLQELVPFSLPVPSWLPESFVFENATMYENDEVISVSISFAGETGDLHMNITNNAMVSQTNPSLGEGKFEEVSINGYPVYITEIEKDGVRRTKGDFFDRQGLLVYISTSLDKQSLIHFIESLK